MNDDDSDQGGEQACWLNLVCDECGALTERNADACWRCDTPLVRTV
ncbi:MAG: hypothetical protein ABWX56_06570 [Mycetocola sp.]